MYHLVLRADHPLKNREIIDEMDLGEFDTRNMTSHGFNRNLQRNIPLLNDNLKTVHRRLLYAMAQMGLWNTKPYTKCAGVVGETMKKFHPHGDQSSYEALVFMGQPWRMLVPLVEYKGNYGNAEDSKSYAAMRYVECRLTEFSKDCFFSEWDLKSDLVDMRPSFNGDGMEPLYLPAKYPYFLMSWGSGMGFGVSTDSPGFLPQDAMQAVIDLIKDPKAKILMYPEDPLGSTIVGRKVFKKFVDHDVENSEENLKFRVRANYKVEHGMIKITSTPYETNPTTITDRIVDLVKKGKLDGIVDVEVHPRAGMIPELAKKSDTAEMIIEIKKGFDAHILMNKLYKLTDLEHTYSLNCVYVDNNKNVQLNLRKSILKWIKFRRKVLKRKYRIDMNDLSKKVYVYEAILKIFNVKNGIEDTIKIIRNNTDEDAIEKVINRFNVSKYQAEEIVGMKLTQLSETSRKRFEERKAEAEAKIVEIRKILLNPNHIDNKIIEQMREGIKKYSRKRQSVIIEAETLAVESDATYDIEITNTGHVRKMLAGFGSEVDPDQMQNIAIVDKFYSVPSSATVFLFTDTGHVYKETISKLIETKDMGIGNKLRYKGDVNIVGAVVSKEETKNTLVFVTKHGTVKQTNCDAYFMSSQGSTAIKLNKGDTLASVTEIPHSGKNRILLYTKDGKASAFDTSEITPTARQTFGVTGIKLDGADEVIGSALVKSSDDHIVTVSSSGNVKKFSLENTFNNTRRATAGIDIVSGSENLHLAIPVGPKNKIVTLSSFDSVEEIELSILKPKTRLSAGEKLLKGRRKTEVVKKD